MYGRRALVIATLISVSVPTIAFAAVNRETDKRRKPTQDAGYFLGYPSPTYSWHGCTKSDTAYNPIPVSANAPKPGKTTQKYVRFTVLPAGYPRFSWKVKPGWRICGVQGAFLLSSKSVSADLLAEAGYTSSTTQGTTAKNGTETIKVPIPEGGIRTSGYEQFEGKTFNIKSVQSISVFVKKK